MSTPSTPLAIIGIGCLFPKANSLGEYWSLLKNGTDAITPIPATHWKPEDYFDADPKKPDLTYAKRGGFLDPYPFPPSEFGIAPNDLEATDTSQLLGLVAAQMALRDAGYGPERDFDRERVGVILGVTGALEMVIPLGARLGHPKWRQAMKDAGVAEAQIDDAIQRIGESYVGWQENSFPGLLGNVVAGRIANRLDLHGTNCAVDAACASSLSAMHLAGLELSTGRSDMVVTGGVDTFNDIFMYMCFSKTPALSPTGDSRPFAANADGTILGEGLGLVVLKRLADAERDGDRIYAVIRGIGTSSDGKGNAIYAPTVGGQVRCLNDAYRQANVTPETIELVEAHGTGTKVGDATEIKAIVEVYSATEGINASARRCALGSVKSQIGHTKAAAGSAGLIKAALALYHKVLPPTIKVDAPAEVLASENSPFYLNTIKRPWLPVKDHPRRAGVSAFGFGGSNFHCVLEEHQAAKPGIDWDGDVQIVALSSNSLEGLRASLGEWKLVDWGAIGAKAETSRRDFRPDAEFRCLLVLTRDGTPVEKMIDSALSLIERSANEPFADLPDGIYFGRGKASGRLGVLFPGQGSQYVGMLRDLACQFPAMQDVLDDANSVFSAQADAKSKSRLSDFIFPPPAFTPDERAEQERSLRATHVAQPALGAVSIGALRVLAGFGISPDAAAGHSFGELTALCAAGVFASSSLHSLSRLRGQLMAEVPEGDPGSMLAVHAATDLIEKTLRDERLDLVVANRNSPSQSVLSGATAEVDRAMQVFKERKARTTKLPVAAAFHSRFVAHAERPFKEALKRIQFQVGKLPVFANSSSQPYPADPEQARAILAGQLARPVDFVQEIVNMYESGVRTFVEVGPGSILTKLVVATLSERANNHGADAFALDSSGGKRSGIADLARSLARLAARGHAVKLSEWEATPPHPLRRPASGKPTLTVPICGANYVKPREKRSPKPAAAPVSLAQTTTKLAPPGQAPGLVRETSTAISTRTATVSESNKQAPAGALAHALQITQEGMAAFQKLQEQTAQLHRQFLQNQETAQQTLNRLIEQQQQLLLSSMGVIPQLVAPTPPPVATPAAPPAAIARPQAAPQPVAIVSPPAAPASNHQQVQKVLLEVVAEKTGYPAEMLNPEMGLDADLGIDSIKRVEILSTLQERLPNAPIVKPEHLGTLNTLGQIIDFLAGGSTKSTPAEPATVQPVETAVRKNVKTDDVQKVLLDTVAEKTGYPAEMLNLDMGLDADLGIDSIKRVEILSTLQEKMPNAPVVKPEHLGTLNTLRQIVAFLSNGESTTSRTVETVPRTNGEQSISRKTLRSAPLPFETDRPVVTLPPGSEIILVAGADRLADQVDELIRARGYVVRRKFWDSPMEMGAGNVGGLILLAPIQSSIETLHNGFRWLRACASALRSSGKRGGTLFATVSRLDGSFGLASIPAGASPISGGLAGLSKTASHEWPEVTCRAIDIKADDPDIDAAARALADELFFTSPIEVGISSNLRSRIELCESALGAIDPNLLTRTDVIVVTGGGRGVTAETALAVAELYRPTLVLLGRSPAPEDEPEWLRGLSDETEIKRAIGARANGSATPREIGRRFQELQAARELRRNLERIATAGARVVYRSVDVRRPDAISDLLIQIRDEFGAITGLIHGAGVIEDRLIEDKTDEQFDRVLGTKAEGLLNLLEATANDPLKILALFSSSTGRFGRKGQVDYAVANEVLNKIARAEAGRRPNCRVASINWGPWEGGMVTPGLRRVFEQEGVGLIPLRDGARFLLAELSAGDRPIETVAGVWLSEPEVPPITETPKPVLSNSKLTPVFDREISVARMPVLAAHVLDRHAVMPLALHMEWLANAALHGNPGLAFHGLADLRVLNGVRLRPDETRMVRLLAGKIEKRDGEFLVPVELCSVTPAGPGQVHSRGQVILRNSLPAESAGKPPAGLRPYPKSVGEVYGSTLFHGEELHALTAVEGVSEDAIVGIARTAPPPAEWLVEPLRNAWLADPLVVDAAFQLLICWGVVQKGVPNLPARVGCYRQFRRGFPTGEIRIVARMTQASGPLIHANIEFLDGPGNLIARIDDAEFVGDANLAPAFRRNRLSVAKV